MPDARRRHQRDRRPREPEPSGPPTVDPLEIYQLMRSPMLRWGDVPGGELLATQLMLHPDDPYLQELFQHVLRKQNELAVLSGDSFHANHPPRGALPPCGPGRIPIATLKTGDVLSIDVADLTKNVVVVGPTGAGKTNWLRILIAAVLGSQT